MTLELPKVSGVVMTAEGRLTDGMLSVTFAGTADSETRDQLDEFVKQVQTEALRLKVPQVIVDFRELEFMNSSCFKIFVAWLAQLRDLTADTQYRIQIRSNPNLLWQRRSLAALSCFAIDLVTIQT
ncbi:MAG TPA: hypothetical protein VGO00_10790 [Kofleriaceae bacterium]|jgi:hypothetical protein|nr:hypothetical protein [Kofleriaceae bacterium]